MWRVTLTLWCLGSTMLPKSIFVVTAHGDLQVSCTAWSPSGACCVWHPFLLGHTELSSYCCGFALLLQALVPKHFSLSALHRISALTATLHMHSRKKTKGKRFQRGQGPRKKIQKSSTGRTTKTQRRRLTGKMGRDQD